jgi:hypothetical protein
MSTEKRITELVADPEVRGVWDDEYPIEYDREEVRRVIREEIAEALTNTSIGGLLIDGTIPVSKLLGSKVNVTIVELAGAWPQESTVNIVNGGLVLVTCLGITAYTSSAPILTGIPIEWDNVEIMRTHLFQNQSGLHLTYHGLATELTNVSPKSHVLRVETPVNGTSDANDFARFSIVDFPSWMVLNG